MGPLDGHKLTFAKMKLELFLRRTSGVAFQDFFSLLMEKAHGADYVRVRPFGRLGDDGCDGYLEGRCEVYACYGAINSDQRRMNYFVGKMAEDLGKAQENLNLEMKSYVFVHNFVDGLPVEALTKKRELEAGAGGVRLSFFGRESFEQVLLGLSESAIEDILGGPLPGRDEVNALDAEEVRQLFAAIATEAEAGRVVDMVAPVPREKLEWNSIEGAWRTFIKNGYQNTRTVSDYLAGYRDATFGERVATWYQTKYWELKEQRLSVGAILTGLLESTAGRGELSVGRLVAVQAILAYFFERCDIFEDVPQEGK